MVMFEVLPIPFSQVHLGNGVVCGAEVSSVIVNVVVNSGVTVVRVGSDVVIMVVGWVVVRVVAVVVAEVVVGVAVGSVILIVVSEVSVDSLVVVLEVVVQSGSAKNAKKAENDLKLPKIKIILNYLNFFLSSNTFI